MNQEQYITFHQVLIVMNRSVRSQKWFLRHGVSQQTLDEMVVFDYLIEYESDNDTYYKPTEKSHEIW